MPGSRLTDEDRGRIAGWLADGLSCAEMARRLGRPTSTITREVDRNGGPERYRADRAAAATRRRAARLGRPAPRPAAVRGFEERFTAMMVRTGLPRMPARVLAGLLTCDEARLSAAELVGRLGVSPASVSKAVGYLAGLGLVRRERDPAGRREYYAVDEDAWYQACRRQVEVCRLWAGAATEGAEVLRGSAAADRLSTVSRYFGHVGQDLAAAAERWRGGLDG
jgi:predicted transcriptional regulator